MGAAVLALLALPAFAQGRPADGSAPPAFDTGRVRARQAAVAPAQQPARALVPALPSRPLPFAAFSASAQGLQKSAATVARAHFGGPLRSWRPRRGLLPGERIARERGRHAVPASATQRIPASR